MTLYPRQNSNFCLQHCCFELSLVSTLQYSTLHIHNSMSIVQLQRGSNLRHSYPMFNVFVWCKMRYACNAIQHSCCCIPNQYPYFAFKFLRLTCDIRVFQCNVDTRCRGAECDIPATQSNILLSALNFTLERPDLRMVVISIW